MRRVITKRPHNLRRGAYPSNDRRFSSFPATSSSRSSVISSAADRGSIYLRRFSTRMHTVSSPSNAMLSPFLVDDRKASIKSKHDIEVDEAFMKLLKAMSVLKSSPVETQVLNLCDGCCELAWRLEEGTISWDVTMKVSIGIWQFVAGLLVCSGSGVRFGCVSLPKVSTIVGRILIPNRRRRTPQFHL